MRQDVHEAGCTRGRICRRQDVQETGCTGGRMHRKHTFRRQGVREEQVNRNNKNRKERQNRYVEQLEKSVETTEAERQRVGPDRLLACLSWSGRRGGGDT